MSSPTISVLLPTLNDGFRLGVQLGAILPQLGNEDELILLLDGSDELTRGVAAAFKHPALKVFSGEKPSGVCAAYNKCAALASCDWILGASGNDEVQPHAIDAWYDAATRWPEARLIQGQLTKEYTEGWTHETSFVRPDEQPAIWRAKGWHSHGASTFLRRDCWGRGYIPEHQWMADSFQSLVLAWRWGVVDLHAWISQVNFREGSFSEQHANAKKYNAVQRAIKKTFAEPEYDDVRAIGNAFDEQLEWLKLRDTGEGYSNVYEQVRLERLLGNRQRIDSGLSLDPESRRRLLMAEPRCFDNTEPVNRLDGLADMISWVKERDSRMRSVIEIGAYSGASGELFALSYQSVTSVDSWIDQPDAVREMFEWRRAKYPHWNVIDRPSEQAVDLIQDRTIDLIYIDADHHYENVRDDILAWRPKVRPGGWLCGHDYGDDEPGVKQAVLEFLGHPDAIFDDSSWVKKMTE